MRARILLASLLVTCAALPAAAQSVKVSFSGGKVNLSAENATVRASLTEWGRVGGTRVVNAERIPRQESVHPACADQRSQRDRAAGVDHHRTSHDCNPQPGIASVLHQRSRLADRRLNLTLRGNAVAHEGEGEAVSFLGFRNHSNAAHSDHDVVSLANVAQTPQALLGIRMTMSVYPALFLCIVVVCLFRYKINKSLNIEIQDALAERRRAFGTPATVTS